MSKSADLPQTTDSIYTKPRLPPVQCDWCMGYGGLWQPPCPKCHGMGFISADEVFHQPHLNQMDGS
jgi:hypothetical protein